MPDNPQTVRAPIVLCHGIAPFDVFFRGFRRSIGHFLNAEQNRWFDEHIGERGDYFRNIRGALQAQGFLAYETAVSFAAGVGTRAADLQKEVTRILNGGGHERVNIIAHSMGGLDARHMIVKLGMAERVASLVTIGTPHLGTSFADWGLQDLKGPDGLVDLLKFVGIDFTGFRDLTTASCQEFGRSAEAGEAENAVLYIVYAGCQKIVERVFAPLQPSWRIIAAREGENDGLVPVMSQRWKPELKGKGKAKRVEQRDLPVPADHLNEVGWWHPWVDPAQTRSAYEAALQEAYVNIAKDLQARGLYR